jgi:hypothetical protein
MKTDNRFALILLAVLAFVIAGFMVETYWDCRLQRGLSMRECIPPLGGAGTVGITTGPTLR